MKKYYFKAEKHFEKLVSLATKILGNSITFILACILVLFWWTSTLLKSNDLHQNIGDFIFGTTFLSLFIIQKSFNRYSALINLKINELIASHETANNSVLEATLKTEHEIRELSKVYIETDPIQKEIDDALDEVTDENKNLNL